MGVWGEMTKQEFIERIAEYVKPTYEKYKVPPSLAVAQACLESGFGKHAPGNNLFGYKATASTKNFQLLWTKEWNGQKYVRVQAKFRKYDSLEDSVEDYLLLLQKPRYTKVKLAQTYFQAAKQVKAAGYATSPVYADSLIRLIKEYKLEVYDEGLVEIWITDHFKWTEFDSPDGEIMSEEIRQNIWLLSTELEKVRSNLGDKPINVTSGWRSPAYNEQIRLEVMKLYPNEPWRWPAKDSFHPKGKAVDIKIAGVSPLHIAQRARWQVGWKGGIGIYQTFVHLDTGPQRAWGLIRI